MNFKRYPLDTQNFSLELQSYAFDSKFLQIKTLSNGVVRLLTNPQYPTAMIYLNQLWTYQTYSTYTLDYGSKSVTNPTRSFSTLFVNLIFQRQPLGSAVYCRSLFLARNPLDLCRNRAASGVAGDHLLGDRGVLLLGRRGQARGHHVEHDLGGGCPLLRYVCTCCRWVPLGRCVNGTLSCRLLQ